MFRSHLAVLLAAPLLLAPSAARSETAAGPLAESYRLYAAGDLPGAVRAMNDLVAGAQHQYFPRVRLAFLQLAAGDFAGAAANYGEAAKLEPSSLEALLGQQQALVAAGKFAEAEHVGRRVLKVDPKNYLGLSRLAWTLYNLKRFDDAAKEYSALLVLYPVDVDMRLGLANARLGAGHKAEAAKSYQEVLDLVPGDKAASAGLAAAR